MPGSAQPQREGGTGLGATVGGTLSPGSPHSTWVAGGGRFLLSV